MEDTPAEVIARRMQAHLAPTPGVIAASTAHEGEARSEGFGVSDTHMTDTIRRRWLPHDDSPAAPEALPLVQARRSTPLAQKPAGAWSSEPPPAPHDQRALPQAVAQRRLAAENPAGAASSAAPAAQVGSSSGLVMRSHVPAELSAGIPPALPAEAPTGIRTETRAAAPAVTPAPGSARPAPTTAAAMTGSATSGAGVVQASRLPDGALLMRAGSNRGRAAMTPAMIAPLVSASTAGPAQEAAGTQAAAYPDMSLQAAPAGDVDVRGEAPAGMTAPPVPTTGSLPRVHISSPRIQAGPAQTYLVQAARVQFGAAQTGTTPAGTTPAGTTPAGRAQSSTQRSPSGAVPAVSPAAGASRASVLEPGSKVWGKPIVQRRPGAQASQTPPVEVQAAAGTPLVRRWGAEPPIGQTPIGRTAVGQTPAGQPSVGQAPIVIQADVPAAGYLPAAQLVPVRPFEGQAPAGAQTTAPEQPTAAQAVSGQTSSGNAPSGNAPSVQASPAPASPAPAVQAVTSEWAAGSPGDPLPLVRGSAAGAVGSEASTNAPGPVNLVQRQAEAGSAPASAANLAATMTSTAASATAAITPGAALPSTQNAAATVLRRAPQPHGSTHNPVKEERSTMPVVAAELPAAGRVGEPRPPMAWHASSGAAAASMAGDAALSIGSSDFATQSTVQTAAAGTRAVETRAAGSRHPLQRMPLQRMPLGGSSSAANSPAPSSSPPAESSASPAASASSASMAAPAAGQTAGETAGETAEVNVERVADAVYAILRDRLIIERESRGLGPI